jgi:DNA-binding GntR family transcriptional regulator
MSTHSLGARPDRLRGVVAEHRGLAGLLAAGDVDGFRKALGRHLDETHRAVVSR